MRAFQSSLRWVLALGCGLGLFPTGCHRAGSDVPTPASLSGNTLVGSSAPNDSAAVNTPGTSPWFAVPEAASPQGKPLVWFEAESAQQTNLSAHHPFEPVNATERDALSGGVWLGSGGQSDSGFAEYSVSVPEAARYEFYARKFWKHGPFRWRFDQQVWQTCSGDVHLLDATPLRKFVEANWVHLGDVELTPGIHKLRIELTNPKGPSAFDAFVLSAGGFVPRGKLKPDEPLNVARAGWFNFDVKPDSFADSVLDLRRLNQPFAGADGFVRAEDAQLVFSGTREPVRFWGVNTTREALFLSEPHMRRFARHLAKFGVNLVRIPAATFRDPDFRQNDEHFLDQIHRFEAALKAEGIYLGLSLYFPLALHPRQADGIPGYEGGQPFALDFFNPDFQELERSWWRHLLTKVNPATGLSLAHDPAVLYVELLNEDSILFWTFNPYFTVPEPQMVLLEQQFYAWLEKKYGSAQRRVSAWGAKPIRGDELAKRRVGVLQPGVILGEHKTERARDTAEFLTRLMRDHYAALQAFIKRDLGYGGLTVCSNWHTADERVFGPLDNWANAACDVMDRHAYVSGPHEGDAASYAVQKGQHYDDQSLLLPKRKSDDKKGWGRLPPFVEPRYDRKPAFLSEVGWPAPNRFRAEGPLLVAAYGRVTGLDAPMWYSTDAPSWARELAKFEVKEPATLGQFPAAALTFRQGLIAEPESLGSVAMSEAELWSLAGGPLSPTPGLDTLRGGGLLDRISSEPARIDPLALLVGPVDIQLGAPASRAFSDAGSAFAAWLDPGAKKAKSRSGDVVWDFAQGLVSLRASRINAAVGFMRGPVELSDVVFELRNDYASAALVALDGQPLSESSRMLLQLMTEVSPAGWAAPGEGKREILDPGGAPLQVKALEGRVRLKRADAASLRVRALDVAGQATHESRAGADEVTLLPNVLYYVVEKK